MGGAEGTRTPDPHTASDPAPFSQICVDVKNPYATRVSALRRTSRYVRKRSKWLPRWLPDDLVPTSSTHRYGALHRPASVEAKKLPPMSEIILIISIRCYATAAANEANRSPGRGACNLHVTAIGRSPSWLTYVAGPRNQNARSSARARANNKMEWPIAA